MGINLRKYLKNILLAIFIALLRADFLLFPVLNSRKIFVKGATFVQPCLLGRDSIRLSMITLIVFSAKLFRSQQTVSSSLITSSKKEVIVLITSFYYDFIFLLLFHFSLV